MSPVHGGKLAARALKEAGVECVFTLCGGHIMPMWMRADAEGIEIVDVRDEVTAVLERLDDVLDPVTLRPNVPVERAREVMEQHNVSGVPITFQLVAWRNTGTVWGLGQQFTMALIVLSFLNFWCAYHYFTAGRTLAADIAAQSPELKEKTA